MPWREIHNYNNWDEFHDCEIVDWKRIRSLIEHENQLINHRTTWLLVSQGFLFAVLGSCIDKSILDVNIAFAFAFGKVGGIILKPLSLIGLLTSVFFAMTIAQAENQILAINDWWINKYEPNGDPWSPSYEERKQSRVKRHPPVFPDVNWLSYAYKYSVLGWLFAIFWCCVLISSFLHLYVNDVVALIFSLVVAVSIYFVGYGIGMSKSNANLTQKSLMTIAVIIVCVVTLLTILKLPTILTILCTNSPPSLVVEILW